MNRLLNYWISQKPPSACQQVGWSGAQQPSKLRARARSRKPPFNDIGFFVSVGKPENDPPRRIYVST
jgi:hypothetical protein